MLLGDAFVRAGKAARGLKLLQYAQRQRGSLHRTIRSELALYVARAYYALRDHDAVERELRAVAEDADIIFARGVELAAWTKLARGDHAASADLFLRTIECLDACRHRDVALEANSCLHPLAIHAAETLDLKLWNAVEWRRSRIDWSAPGLARSRFWITYYSTAIMESQGQPVDAYAAADLAYELAPSDAFRVSALCRHAALCRDANEPIGQRRYALRAQQLFAMLNVEKLAEEEVVVPLTLALELADIGDVRAARQLLAQYRDRPLRSAMLSLTDDPRLEALELSVEAGIQLAAGDRAAAHSIYVTVFEIYRRIGYLRRASAIALRLVSLKEDVRNDELYEFVVTATAGAAPTAWYRQRVADRVPLYADEIARGLTTVQREVLRLVCEGKTTAQIAAIRGRSPFTIRNMIVEQIFKAYGVSNRAALTFECARRGIIERPRPARRRRNQSA